VGTIEANFLVCPFPEEKRQKVNGALRQGRKQDERAEKDGISRKRSTRSPYDSPGRAEKKADEIVKGRG